MARISHFFYDRGFNILRCQQYTDVHQNRYFMRIALDLSALDISRKQLEEEFSSLSREFTAEWSAHYQDEVPKMAIMATKNPHCLYDLLVRVQENDLHCEVPLIISNHPTLEKVADQFKIPFYCLKVDKSNKLEQEQAVIRLLRQHHIDLVVLARYMQILTGAFVAEFPNQIINIHHAFLPAFQGANPYLKAYERGVKMIGATAHYVTEQLDEGPIIEQDVIRVNHKYTNQELSRIGSDIERIVLSRAVKYHLEHRILVSGNRTIVFT